MSEGAGVALPSRDSGPQAGAAPWWAVSGTAVWASPVCLRPGVPHSDRTSPGGLLSKQGPCWYLCLLGGGGCQLLPKRLPGGHLPGGLEGLQEPPLWGRVTGGTDSTLHSQANSVCSAAPGTQCWARLGAGRISPLPEAPVPTALNATLWGCSRGPTQMWECGLDSVGTGGAAVAQTQAEVPRSALLPPGPGRWESPVDGESPSEQLL